MALCIDPAASIVAGSGIYITGSGTPGDPWVLSVTDPVDIVDIQNDIANLQAAMLTLPSTYVNAAGDTMTGTLTVNASSVGLRLRRQASDFPLIDFYEQTGVTRQAYIQSSPNGLLLNSDDSVITFRPLSVERARITATGMLIGKTVDDTVATAGVELDTSGRVLVGRSIGASNFVSNKYSTADNDGAIHFEIKSAGTPIGKIYRVTASTVAILSTSDADLKENFTEIDDELALLWMRLVQPSFFNFKDRPDVTHVGYSAQATAELWPDAVTAGVVGPGHGNVEDRTWDEDGNETTPEDVWSPWMMGHGELGPFLHAALQALDRLTLAQQVTIDAQAAQIADLTARVEALELIAKPK